MAYAAAISLKQTIQHLLNSSKISIDPSSQEILDVAYKQLTSLQQVLKKSDERLSSKRLKALEGEIRLALHKLEDSLESHSTDQLQSSHGEEEVSPPKVPLELDMKELWPELNSFAEVAKKMEEDYNTQLLHNQSSNDDDDDDVVTSFTIDYGVEMVGLSETYTSLKDHLIRITRPDEFGFFSFFGMPGTGRSILAKSVYDDIYGSFDCGAWVRIGSTYQLKQILQSIISQINDGNIDHDELEGDEEMGEYVYKCLEGRRYIVALDDLRDTEILIQLRRSFPEQNNGSLVFVTTGLTEVAEFDGSFVRYELPTLVDENFTWPYIRLFFFGENGSISPEFDEIVRKIAKNCGCLRVVVARVMLVLRKMKREAEMWGGLAAAEDDRIYVVDDEISEASEVQKYLGEEDQVWAKNLFDVSILKDRVKENLYPDRLFPKMGIMTIYGMAGVGKTSIMKKLYGDPSVLQRFDHSVWVNVGPKYKSEKILVDTLAQIYPNIDGQNINDDAKLVSLCAQLCHKKCLIVLDDLWSQEPVHFLKKFLPNIKGELIVTTRLFKVGMFGPWDRIMKLRLMTIEESWDLLREKVFGKETCPYQLEKVGRKIAEKCEGLPLLILLVADILSKSEKTLEYWNMVATRQDPVIVNSQIEVSKSLVTSYERLPQHLQACFLYMGVFPRNHEISISKLIKLWFAEGFLEPNPSQTFEDFASRCLRELVRSTMVMVRQSGSSDLNTNKTCGLHSVFWHLSRNEAIESEFFHILKVLDDKPVVESAERQRRLCIPNSISLGIKDDAMVAFSAMRALLCTGPPHQYPVPLCFGSRFLKVLEALTIRFYEFPVEVVKQIHLRYLALTCDGNLPPSISKLWNLQFLIVKQYLSIEGSSQLPNEIWDLKELKHLEVSGRQLPDPNCEALLPNLSSLLDVSIHSCTDRVFKGIPNLKKLGIQIELAPDDNTNPFNYLDHVSHLSKLESLKCVVVNPDLGLEGVAPSIPTSMFPSSLKKLSLSGLGYSWEYMSIISKLQNLEVLKLQCYAFMGPYWEIDGFYELIFLSIEDTDLVRCDRKMLSIPKLKFLSFKHCYNLEELPSYLPPPIQKIEVVESHPLCENWAKQMRENNYETKMETLEHSIQSSWND